MGVELLRIGDDLRQARDSESAHLEAVLKDSGAKALRLARLRDVLRDRSDTQLDLQMLPGIEPRLWLDLRTCVVMRPDAGTFQLASHGHDRIETILETGSLDEMVAACSSRLAHGQVFASRQANNRDASVPEIAPAFPSTLVYVWMMGVITGVAILALCAIYMKKMGF